MNTINTILFDLDGTLADTAPDLAGALDALMREEGRDPLPFARVRDQVSHGTSTLVRLGFPEADEEEFQRLRRRFLDIYGAGGHSATALFPGMASLLSWIERRRMKWGVVTNKPSSLTDALMDELVLTGRAACIVSGDTTAERKPHPLPMLHACELVGSTPDECIYIGDASRDIEAGRAAGMATLIALYGYIDEGERPEEWGADAMIREPREILDWLLAAEPSLTPPSAGWGDERTPTNGATLK